ncbi:MAG: hypothetical protein JWQ76_2581 [Ramlibacter sp.]|nr:hypothetical protein [Ramlibacter sp.]
MSRFRILLACLLLLAIPLQGIAAASMLYCGAATSHSHDEVQAPSHHDHSADVHAAAQADDAAAAAGLPDQDHKCGACATCCHGAAIAATFTLLSPSPAPQAHAAEPVVHLHSRSSPVPDKPPRA